MPRQRRRPIRRAQVRPTRSASRSQNLFSVLALLTVVAMLIGAVGSAVFLDLFRRDGEAISVDPVQGDPEDDEVEQLFRADVAARPDDPQALATLANYLSQGEKADEGLRLYEQALAIVPDDAAIRLDFAQALSEAGSSRDAELQFTKVIEAEPANGLALLDLAQLYRDWSPPRTDEAIATYQRIVGLGIDSVTVEIATEELAALGVVVPVASPAGSPEATPAT